jgi:hypothetical protein
MARQIENRPILVILSKLPNFKKVLPHAGAYDRREFVERMCFPLFQLRTPYNASHALRLQLHIERPPLQRHSDEARSSGPRRRKRFFGTTPSAREPLAVDAPQERLKSLLRLSSDKFVTMRGTLGSKAEWFLKPFLPNNLTMIFY